MVDRDLEKFLDRVDQDLVLGLVAVGPCLPAGQDATPPASRSPTVGDRRRLRRSRAGERVMASVTRLVTTRLKLRVKATKSAVDQPWRRKFPVGFADIPPGDRPKADGFSFTPGTEPPRRRVAPQALARLKKRVRELTRRARGISLPRMVEDLRA